MNFGEKLRLLRTEKGLTLKELGELTNQTFSNISRYERGIREPNIETIKMFADFFNVSVDYLLGLSEKENKSKNEIKQEFKPTLTSKDEKDIAKDLDSIMTKLQNEEDGPIYYNGTEVDSEDAELFRELLEVALKKIKIKNKETYTPKKYRK
ncbi:HTH-type transcriptional regulator ImmR [bioreactor metagenome]|uniref:HTH-type transcriptional regulator ImmR n=1 Tax=bioreactor metagenome TaxID=1076179 RepID=A0A645JKP3_9ZZZZ